VLIAYITAQHLQILFIREHSTLPLESMVQTLLASIVGGTNRGFLYDGSTYTDIIYPGASDTQAFMNRLKHCWIVVGGTYIGFLYNGSTFTDIIYPGATSTIASGIG
jgi:hypothetical protein